MSSKILFQKKDSIREGCLTVEVELRLKSVGTFLKEATHNCATPIVAYARTKYNWCQIHNNLYYNGLSDHPHSELVS